MALEDLIGALNYFQGRMYGLLLMSNMAKEKLQALFSDPESLPIDFGLQLIHVVENEADFAMEKSWGRGESYILF